MSAELRRSMLNSMAALELELEADKKLGKIKGFGFFCVVCTVYLLFPVSDFMSNITGFSARK